MKYDLENRTTQFGILIIEFCKKILLDPITKPLVSQIIRSSTSIGANYCEANEAESRKDFIHKIRISKKEAHETYYWLKMISGAFPACRAEALVLLKESKELTLIFNAIIKSTLRKN